MGKRVNFSGRSVISPDPIMDMDEIGIPYSVAMNLTVQEKVQPHNIKDLSERVRNGSGNIHGAETLITEDGESIQLEHCQHRADLRLMYGMTVERYLRDGDYVVFNRQPSLHRMGMMGHRVRLMPGMTFRLNLACNNPYSARCSTNPLYLHHLLSRRMFPGTLRTPSGHNAARRPRRC
jgi:DNA-directed RNA polymerase II subunit RPB1